MPLDTLLEHLQKMAEQSLSLWDIPREAYATLINVSENVTYRVEAGCGFKAILRIHRENYHSRHAIECELAWLEAIVYDGVVPTHRPYQGRDGQPVQSARIDGLDGVRNLVLFTFLEGHTPEGSDDMAAGFEMLGGIAARCHDHVLSWTRPPGFERMTWDINAVFGVNPVWGNWRDGPFVSPEIRHVLERVERTVRARLAAFGQSPSRFNLIHADMRLANILVHGEQIRLIDFDDCGFGWFLYDFAAAISFIEDDPRIPELKAAWLSGYRRIRDLSTAEEAEIDTFVMLRRMALLAWIGSHIEAPEPQALAPDFAAVTARLGEVYLSNYSAP